MLVECRKCIYSFGNLVVDSHTGFHRLNLKMGSLTIYSGLEIELKGDMCVIHMEE